MNNIIKITIRKNLRFFLESRNLDFIHADKREYIGYITALRDADIINIRNWQRYNALINKAIISFSSKEKAVKSKKYFEDRSKILKCLKYLDNNYDENDDIIVGTIYSFILNIYNHKRLKNQKIGKFLKGG